MAAEMAGVRIDTSAVLLLVLIVLNLQVTTSSSTRMASCSGWSAPGSYGLLVLLSAFTDVQFVGGRVGAPIGMESL